jgi:hypothetical protein
VTLAVHESDALGNDDFARARFDDFARAGFDRARGFFAGAGFNRAGGFHAGAGFNRAGGFHARAGFNRARGFHAGAGNFSTARSFDPPPGLGRNFVNPNRIFVSTIRIHGVALAFCHFLEAGIVAVFTIVTLTVHESDALGNDDFAGAGFDRAGRFHAGAGFDRARRFHARAGFNRAGGFHTGAGFNRAGGFHAGTGFNRARRFHARARNFFVARRFNPPGLVRYISVTANSI